MESVAGWRWIRVAARMQLGKGEVIYLPQLPMLEIAGIRHGTSHSGGWTVVVQWMGIICHFLQIVTDKEGKMQEYY